MGNQKHSRTNSNLRSVFIAALWCLLFLLGAVSADAARVELSWSDENVVGYHLYYGTTSGNYAYVVDAGNVTTYTLADLPDGPTYYFAVKTRDAAGNESGYSNEVAFDASPCAYTLSPSSASFGTAGGSGTVTVTTQTGCSWTAMSNDNWVTITSGTTATSTATVSYTVTPNTGAERTTVSTIAGSLFTITQSGITSYALTTTTSGTGTGTITTNPTGTSFAAGTVVTLNAAADTSSTFTGWSGACSGTATTCQVTMDAAKSATATFAAKTFTITSSSSTGGTISPAGTTTVNYGSSKTYTITPKAGYRVRYLIVDSVRVSTTTTYTFTNIKAKHSIKAYFGR